MAGPMLRTVAHSSISQAPIIIAFCALLAGCASGGQPAPEWPTQPSPSYPTPPSAQHQVGDAPTTEQESSLPEKSLNSSPSSSLAKEYEDKNAIDTLEGKATYYADSLAGNHTASGDVYDPGLFTAAHKKLPFGTVARVTRNDTGAVTYVKINDRGPFGAADRIIDLSKAAAKELDMLKAGVVSVKVEILDKPEK